MIKDFRLKAGYFENFKVRKLHRQLGDAGLLAHLTLLVHTAENKQSGDLGKVSDADIELMGEWDYDNRAGQFAKSLFAARLLDRREDGKVTVHDWAEHNPYVSTGKSRRKKSAKPEQVDFRVATSFRRNLKIRQLEKEHGPAGVVSLVRLWAHAAIHRTKGDLVRMTYADIALAAGWSGEYDADFVRSLVRIGLLDATGSDDDKSVKAAMSCFDGDDDPDAVGLVGLAFAIHDWEEWNGYRYGAEARSAQAREAAKARWKSEDANDSIETATQKANEVKPIEQPKGVPASVLYAPPPMPAEFQRFMPSDPISTITVEASEELKRRTAPGGGTVLSGNAFTKR
ncbi:MAG: hypothetical protein WA208_18630 [Thermoanaerobaculia bacterium]